MAAGLGIWRLTSGISGHEEAHGSSPAVDLSKLDVGRYGTQPRNLPSTTTKEEGRSQAEVLRAAVDAYEPRGSSDRNFALAAGFRRLDDDPRPISEISERDLLDGFGT